MPASPLRFSPNCETARSEPSGSVSSGSVSSGSVSSGSVSSGSVSSGSVSSGSVSSGSVSLRPIEAADRSFLIDLYAATRATELAMVPWSEEQKRAFVESQFNAQDTHYRATHPRGSFDLVVYDGQPAGRLLLSHSDADVRLIDIAVAPEFQRQGIGGSLLRTVMADAAVTGRSVSLHVERFNTAANWYRSLGFVDIGSDAVYLAMRWIPTGNPP